MKSFFQILFFYCAVCSVGATPNVLVIVADDLGFSDLGSYGGEIDTPHLDALAKDGVRLTRFYNTGRCCPSRAAILTGQYPHRVGLGHMTQDIGRPGYQGKVSSEAQTIAQVIAPAGYRSFISGKWHLGTDDPTRHGFEEFYGTLVSAKRFFDPDHLIRLPKGRPKIEYENFYATDAVTDHALQFLDLARHDKDPWFLYLAYHAPHFPLHAFPEDIKKYAKRYQVGWDAIRDERLQRMKNLGIVADDLPLPPRSDYWNYGETKTGTNPAWNSLEPDRQKDLARRMAIYAAMVDRMDQQIGRVFANLKKNDEWNNTLVVFLSDNGACAEWDPHGFDIKSSNQNILHRGAELENMGQAGTFHSAGSGWANASNTPWRLYKHFNHEGGICSPCIIRGPGLEAQKNTIFRGPTHIIDLMPTIADLAEIKAKGALSLPGNNLVSEITSPNGDTRRDLFFEHEGNRAVHSGPWKLVARRDLPWELYDSKTDRNEMIDLAGKNPDIVAMLAKRWDQWAEQNKVTPLPNDYGVGYLKVRN